MKLRDTIESALAAHIDVETRSASDGTTSWSVGGVEFADTSADGRVATFRLDQVLASAAQRTPDTSGSSRGAEWVDFAPTSVDAHAIDRAGAWALAAYRRARR